MIDCSTFQGVFAFLFLILILEELFIFMESMDVYFTSGDETNANLPFLCLGESLHRSVYRRLSSNDRNALVNDRFFTPFDWKIVACMVNCVSHGSPNVIVGGRYCVRRSRALASEIFIEGSHLCARTVCLLLLFFSYCIITSPFSFFSALSASQKKRVVLQQSYSRRKNELQNTE